MKVMWPRALYSKISMLAVAHDIGSVEAILNAGDAMGRVQIPLGRAFFFLSLGLR